MQSVIEKLKQLATEMRDKSRYAYLFVDQLEDIIDKLENPSRPIQGAAQQDQEFISTLHTVCNAIIESSIKDPPEHYWKFTKPPEDFTCRDLLRWFEATESYFHIAKMFEEKHRGSVCCVDRARQNYLLPKCKELFEYLLENKKVKNPWRPIPKNLKHKTKALVASDEKDYIVSATYYRVGSGYWIAEEGLAQAVQLAFTFIPTRYMPLPQPPGEGDA